MGLLRPDGPWSVESLSQTVFADMPSGSSGATAPVEVQAVPAAAWELAWELLTSIHIVLGAGHGPTNPATWAANAVTERMLQVVRAARHVWRRCADHPAVDRTRLTVVACGPLPIRGQWLRGEEEEEEEQRGGGGTSGGGTSTSTSAAEVAAAGPAAQDGTLRDGGDGGGEDDGEQSGSESAGGESASSGGGGAVRIEVRRVARVAREYAPRSGCGSHEEGVVTPMARLLHACTQVVLACVDELPPAALMDEVTMLRRLPAEGVVAVALATALGADLYDPQARTHGTPLEGLHARNGWATGRRTAVGGSAHDGTFIEDHSFICVGGASEVRREARPSLPR